MDNLDFDLDSTMLTEAFDSVNLYPTVNLKPKNATPSMFLVKNGNDDIVVRLLTLNKEKGTLVNLKPNDRNIFVDIVTVNEKGKDIVFTGDFGENPLKTIVTIFDLVFSNINDLKAESVVFRFNGNKLKGKKQAIVKIIGKLAQTRGKGRLTLFKEMLEINGKFVNIVLKRKNLDVEDLPGATVDTDKYEVVKTNVGETLIDKKTGKTESKAAAVAESFTKVLNNISEREAMNKIKLSRRSLISAQYQANVAYSATSKAYKEWEEIADQTFVRSSVDAESADNVFKRIENKVTEDEVEYKIGEIKQSIQYGNIETLPYSVERYIATNMKESGESDKELLNRIGKLLVEITSLKAKVTPQNFDETIARLMKLSNEYNLTENMPNVNRQLIQETATQVKMKTINPLAQVSNESYSEEQKAAIARYCGNDFRKINQYLFGQEKATADIKKTISEIDGVFEEKGFRLPKGTKLYRGMRIPATTLKKIERTKVFYFRNFVSTSIAPLIYLGGFAETSTIKVSPNELSSDENYTNLANENGGQRSYGIIINGAENIKTLIPGSLSPYESECEVILPRGTAIRIDKVFVGSNENNTDSALFHSTVIKPEQLDEGTVVYDGDALLESGELVEIPASGLMSFSMLNDVNELKEKIIDVETNQLLADISAECIVDLPFKFLEC